MTETVLPSARFIGCFFHVTGLVKSPEIPYGITNLNYCYEQTSLIEAPVIPDSVTSLYTTFAFCSHLVKVPVIPITVTNLFDTFYNCNNLIEVQNVPSTVKNLSFTFFGCESLRVIKNWGVTDGTVLTANSHSFDGCNSLETISLENYQNFSVVKSAIINTNPPFNVDDVVKVNTTVPFSELNTWLLYAPANTERTAYQLNITNLLSNNIVDSSVSGSLGKVLQSNNTKYVDLSKTVLPEGLTNLDKVFYSVLSLVKSPNIPSGVISLEETFRNCHLIEMPDIPDGVINMTKTFYGIYGSNSSFTETKRIPNSVMNMSYCFYNNKNLLTVSNIPPSVTTLNNCFSYCSSLKAIDEWNFVENENLDVTDIFKGVTSITSGLIYTSTTKQEIDLKWALKNQLVNYTSVIKSRSNEVPYDILADWLYYQTPNTSENPYSIKITELTPEVMNDSVEQQQSPLATKLFRSDVFVNIEETEYPAGLENMSFCFAGCSNLVKVASSIPDSVTDLTYCFWNCTSLKEAPLIPSSDTGKILDGVYRDCTSLESTPALPHASSFGSAFASCSSLVSVPNVPIVDIDENFGNRNLMTAFSNCTNLEIIEHWDMSIEETQQCDMTGCFSGCASLQTIIVDKVDPESVENKWYEYRVEFDSLNSKAVVTQFAIGEFQSRSAEQNARWTAEVPYQRGTTMKLSFATDELTVGETNAITPELIAKFIKYRVPYATHRTTSNILDPARNNFVIWANDPNEVKCNFLDVSVKMDDSEFDYVFREE